MNAFFDATIGGPVDPFGHGTHSYGGPERRSAVKPLTVGIVNNMPDSALVATERQFTSLVRNAVSGSVDIRLYHIPGLPRSDEARDILASRYEPVSALRQSRIDALIVTGNEPRAARIDQEPYWHDLTELVGWASDNTRSTLWSCLAAHAAVLHLDGIERRRLPQKKSGVLASEVSDPLRHMLPPQLSVCHSRMNEVNRQDLVCHGYNIVSEAPGGHVDIFSRNVGSDFLFLQGHPEYDADSLMREFRRDVGRFLDGYREVFPDVPENYFDSDSVVRMANYRTLAERTRDIRLFAHFPAATLRRGLETRLAQSAAAVFAAWMAKVAALAEAA